MVRSALRYLSAGHKAWHCSVAMRRLPEIFENNRAWVRAQNAQDPTFFDRQLRAQHPRYLWIGCADSRVSPTAIAGLEAGDMLIHRNMGNLVSTTDANSLSVIKYGVDVLQVEHIIVCGHERCAAVRAALGPSVWPPMEQWLAPLRAVCRDHRKELDRCEDYDERWIRLAELNVAAQVATIGLLPTLIFAWKRG